jgi:hypothetical protein
LISCKFPFIKKKVKSDSKKKEREKRKSESSKKILFETSRGRGQLHEINDSTRDPSSLLSTLNNLFGKLLNSLIR